MILIISQLLNYVCLIVFLINFIARGLWGGNCLSCIPRQCRERIYYRWLYGCPENGPRKVQNHWFSMIFQWFFNYFEEIEVLLVWVKCVFLSFWGAAGDRKVFSDILYFQPTILLGFGRASKSFKIIDFPMVFHGFVVKPRCLYSNLLS